MSRAGWYPDPGGQPGLYRWWDGAAWTSSITAHPQSAPPNVAGGTFGGPSGQAQAQYAQLEAPPRRPIGAIIVVGLLFVGLVVGGWWMLSSLGLNAQRGAQQPASNPTGDICPRQIVDVNPTPHVNPPGRVQGGALSYPELGAPWGPVINEDRIPFGRDAYGQTVMVEPNYDGLSSWVASVVVGELVAGDGFFSPQQGAEIVSRCVLGQFYGNAVIDRSDRVNQATTVDGHDAWIVEMHLGFSIPRLKETGETAIIIIVATRTDSASIYYASIPDSRPELLAKAREVQSQLRVEK